MGAVEGVTDGWKDGKSVGVSDGLPVGTGEIVGLSEGVNVGDVDNVGPIVGLLDRVGAELETVDIGGLAVDPNGVDSGESVGVATGKTEGAKGALDPVSFRANDAARDKSSKGEIVGVGAVGKIGDTSNSKSCPEDKTGSESAVNTVTARADKHKLE